MKLLLACAATIIVNHTKVWNKHDQHRMEVSKQRCAELFPDAPCLKKFIKLNEQRYQVLCSQSK
jgi:hypothetical protein